MRCWRCDQVGHIGSCCASLLIYIWCMIGTFLVHCKRHLLAVWLAHVLWMIWHTYMGFIILWYWCMVMYIFGTLIDGICLMILHHCYYLISTTIGICLIHGYGTWFMMETYHEWYDTLFAMLVDSHGWHIGICTWLAYW